MDSIPEQPKLVSIIAPVYNEESLIDQYLQRVINAIEPLSKRYRFEIVLVDDGSRDNSLEIIKRAAVNEPRLRVVQLRRNYGQTAALQAGLDEAGGEIIITMDADLQHFPEEIPAFLHKLEEGYDVVCGWRHHRDEDILRRWPSRMANFLIKKISGIDIHDFGTTFRSYRSKYAKDLRLLGESHRYLPVLIKDMGGKVVEIPIENVRRQAGKSNYGLGRTIGVFLDLILLEFLLHYLDRPMRAFGKIALVSFFLAIFLMAWVTYDSLRLGINAVQSRMGTFLVAVILIITSIQILLTGILSEIMVRVFYNLGDRRVYRIREIWNHENIDHS